MKKEKASQSLQIRSVISIAEVMVEFFPKTTTSQSLQIRSVISIDGLHLFAFEQRGVVAIPSNQVGNFHPRPCH